ncbi:cation:proton antiporter [Isoptericola sp. b515]|uniref:cation:proton antiporter n=1 Tax=Isoptericola sp. b515 TaxID=3064652 RepID=UPI002713BCCE|nr:cation:proton antiporter [Isoptericola sp. b515]MDO8148147.1 cation:proton antiporter [Isoptericola sp. b515]
MDDVDVFVNVGTVVALGVGAQWLARTLHAPAIVLLLFAGILAGPVTGLVDPPALFGDSLDPLITLAVGLLLFDAGFSLRFADIGQSRTVVLRLVTVGLVVTWAVGAAASYLVFGLAPGVAVLLGAVLVVSGPTVVGPILAQARPSSALSKLLTWEGTLLDPIGAALGVAVLTVVTSGAVLEGAGQLLATAGLGIAVGLAGAMVLVASLRYFLVPDDLQVPVAFMMAVAVFVVATSLLPEAGLFATLTTGLVLANQRWAFVSRVRSFGETVGTLVIGVLFIVLAAQIQLDDLRAVLVPSLVLLGVLVLAARPLATLLSTVRTSLTRAERGFVASVAPRGVVAASTVSAYAISLSAAGLDPGPVVPVTFAVIIGAGIVYGFGSPVVARLLGVSRRVPGGVAFFGPEAVARPLATRLAEAGVPVVVVTGDVAEPAEQERPYDLFAEGLDADELPVMLADAGIGSAVVTGGSVEHNAVAMGLAAGVLGSSRVHYVPGRAGDTVQGIGAAWRRRMPARRRAFGTDVTLATLRSVGHGEEALTWLPVEAATAGSGTVVPLFAVGPQHRATVATPRALSRLERARDRERTRLLCLVPSTTGDAVDR